MITAIVAYNAKFVIGDEEGKIPWHIPDEYKHFKETTIGCSVIMGRKTYVSLPKKFRPLPKRTNIIVSFRPLNYIFEEEYKAPEDNPIYWFEDVESAIRYGKKVNEDNVFILGGAMIYEYVIKKNFVDRVLASEVKNYLRVKPGAYFPDLVGERGWKREVKLKHKQFKVVELTPPHFTNTDAEEITY